MRPNTVTVVERLKSVIGKHTGLEVCEPLLHWVFESGKKPIFEACRANVIVDFVYCLHTGCFRIVLIRFAQVGTERRKLTDRLP